MVLEVVPLEKLVLDFLLFFDVQIFYSGSAAVQNLDILLSEMESFRFYDNNIREDT